jgi:hypothetical protein
MIDFAHKIVRPSTYSCDLCSLTHGNFNEHAEWAKFRTESKVEMEFYHIEDFEKKFDLLAEYPLIYKQEQTDLTVLLDRDELAIIESTDELIGRLKAITQI